MEADRCAVPEAGKKCSGINGAAQAAMLLLLL